MTGFSSQSSNLDSVNVGGGSRVWNSADSKGNTTTGIRMFGVELLKDWRRKWILILTHQRDRRRRVVVIQHLRLHLNLIFYVVWTKKKYALHIHIRCLCALPQFFSMVLCFFGLFLVCLFSLVYLYL